MSIQSNSVKLVSWNVNGLRAVIRKNEFQDFLKNYNPDILCLQEVKATADQVEPLWEGYFDYWNPAKRKGYSGTTILTRYKPTRVRLGMEIEEHDQEGRLMTLEFAKFFLVNVYAPNSQNELRRLEYRVESWEADFLKYIRSLEDRKPVIFCGDLNVAHKPIDLARPAQNERSPGYTKEERDCLDRLLKTGYVDTFRLFHPEPNRYSWWSYRAGARERNVGWRIDYFCASEKLKSSVEGADILSEVHGSDHCPVVLDLNMNCFKG